MALQVGKRDASSGLAKEIYDNLSAVTDSTFDFDYKDANGATVSSRITFENKLKDTAYATAKAVVEYIKAEADVQVRSNILIDSQFWTWFNLLIGVLTASGGVTLSPAMATFLITNPIPTTLISQSNKKLSPLDGVQ